MLNSLLYNPYFLYKHLSHKFSSKDNLSCISQIFLNNFDET